MRTPRWLLAALLVAGAAGSRAGAPDVMAVDLIAQDLPAATIPATPEVSSSARGNRVQVVVPYRQQGTWLRIALPALPADARLVVNGVAMERVMLVMPDGRRIERDKTRPSADTAASAVAAAFALPADLAAGSVVWLHSFDHNRNVLEIRLMSGDDWHARERTALAFSLAVYGAFAAFIIIAATYWAILRERMFADHAFYLTSLLVFMAMSSGLFYVAFGGGIWSRQGIQAQWGFGTAAIGFAIGFATRFIDIARYFPRAVRALDALRIGYLALALAVTISPIPTPFIGAAVGVSLVPVNLALVGLGIYIAMKRNRYANYFLLGWIPLTIGTSMRALQGTGLVAIAYDMSFAYALGVIWEALVLTAGIADRALSFRRERDVARHLAQHDGLTGVLNRRAAQARLDESLRRSRSASSPLAVFFLDLDHFKSINDRHGHAAGDAVLVATAKRIAAQLRADDVLGRWGGEEFVVVLPGAPPEVARATGERIRRVVEAEPVHVEGTLIAVTVSVGLAMLDASDEDSAALVQRADSGLYRAKENGRNRLEEAMRPS